MRIGFSFLLAIDVIQTGHWMFALLRRFNVEPGTRVLLVKHKPAWAGRRDWTIQVIDGIVAG